MASIQIERGDGSLISCDPVERSLSYYRYHVKFTPLEWKLLEALYRGRNSTVKRSELITLIWGQGKDVPTRTIDVHISSIRRKLSYIKGARIDSIYGEGYKLIMLSRF